MLKDRTDRILGGLLVVLLAAFAYVVVDAMRERIVEAGDSAPNFSITTDTGRTITRSDFGGKLLVLNFWATWCPPCIEEIPSLDRLQKNFAGSGLVVLGVSVDTNQKLYEDFLRRDRVSFQTARDPESNISASYGTFKYPETYIIDQKGRVVAKIIGSRDWTSPDMVNMIKSLL